MKISEGKLDEFKRQAAMCILQVKEKNPGTLQYDWFLNSDETKCEIREAYESFEAILAHMSNLRERLGILFEQYATDHSVILYGDPSPELIQTAKTRGVEVRTYSFLQGLD